VATDSGWQGFAREHPIITALLVGCTLAGAVLGEIYLYEEWSAARRIAAGAVAGAGVALTVTATKMIG
jgi:hypothetical protein